MSEMPNPDALAWDMTDRLHKSMRYSGKTSSELAADLGVHRNTVANFLAGRTPRDRRTLMAWAMATGVSVEWLETGESGSVTPPSPPNGPRGKRDEAALARLTAAKRARNHSRVVPETYLPAA